MKEICIFGFGGFAREVYWMALQCNKKISAFIDIKCNEDYYGAPVVDENYFDPNRHSAIVAIGNPKLREKTVQNLIDKYKNIEFETLISPFANIMSPATVKIGNGTIICANCVLTANIEIGPWSQLNLATTIGHDVVTGKFMTTAPGVHINGKVKIDDYVYFGSNSSTIENINICNNVIIGAGACVTKNIITSGVYVGIPAFLKEK